MRYLYILCFLFVSAISIAQTTFQRTYEAPGRFLLHGSMDVLDDGSFYLMNLFFDAADNIFKLHITNHHYKGDILWSFDYDIDDLGDFLDLSMDIVVTPDKGAAFTISKLNGNGTQSSRIIGKLTKNGTLEWSKTLEADDTSISFAEQNTLETNFTGGLIYGGTSSDNDAVNTDSYLSSMNIGGEIEWSKLYKNLKTDSIENFSLYRSLDKCEFDTTYMITGQVDTAAMNTIFLSKIDTLGEMRWSKQFGPDLGDGVGIQAYDVASGDTTTAVTGVIVDTTGFLRSFVMQVDSSGNLMWSKFINLPGSFPITLNSQVEIDFDQNVILAGRFLDAVSGETLDFFVKLTIEGDIFWSKSFPRIDSYVLDQNLGFLAGGDLQVLADGYMYSATAANFQAGTLYPFVVRSDKSGNAICDEPAMADVDTDIPMTSDTLLWDISDYLFTDTLTVDIDTFSDYDLPVLFIQDTFFCPQDPVFVILDATLEDASAYEWDTGETTPTLTVEEEGEYMVTVTIDTLACFTLCDTSIISVLDNPSVSIVPNFSLYCENGTVPLSAFPSEGLPGYEIMWANGETGTQLVAEEFGDYAVTITDQCGNTANASFTLGDNNVPQPVDPQIDFNQTLFCTTGEYSIRILNSGDFDNIMWSTGETDVASITVPSPGTYSVTATNCLETVTASIDADGFLELEPLEVNTLTDNGSFCIDQSFPLVATPTGGLEPYEFAWSTGDTEPTITVFGLGDYMVTVTDACFNEVVEIFSLGEDLLPPAVTPTLLFDQDTFCVTSMLEVQLENADQLTNIEWSNGVANASSIVVPETGEYSVTALSCFQEVFAAIVVDAADILEPVKFPNTFIPGSEEEMNRTFGPHLECPAVVEEYELKVFNRWGKLMFESDRVEVRWNGATDGDTQPSAVYFWYSRYTGPAGEEILEGDVVLLR